MRNCSLELHHPSADSRFPNPNETQHQEQQQRLTIFYNGMVCVRDVTELQARFILFLANKEMEERVNSLFTPQSGSAEPPSPNVMSPLCSPVAGMSMKKSLQRFLQKKASDSSNISIPSLGMALECIIYGHLINLIGIFLFLLRG